MEKETFIYKRKLESIAEEIHEKFDVRIIFCEIFGNRWSWFAGCDEYFICQKKLRISKDLGVIVEDDRLEEAFLKELKTGIACSLASVL